MQQVQPYKITTNTLAWFLEYQTVFDLDEIYEYSKSLIEDFEQYSAKPL